MSLFHGHAKWTSVEKRGTRTDLCLLWPVENVGQAQYGVGFKVLTLGKLIKILRVPKVLPIW
jgi:hypothetical protein